MNKVETANNLVLIYPFNLFAETLSIKKDSEVVVEVLNCTPGSLIETVEEELTEREQAVVMARFAKGMTLQDIGESVTNTKRERVRQIIAKALRKLRHPRRLKRFYHSNQHYEAALKHKSETIAALTEQLLAEKNKVYHLENGLLPPDSQEYQHNTGLPVEALDLSARSYNCLKRAGCNTVQDIMLKVRPDDEPDSFCLDLYRVRNLGRRSLEEILYKLKELGLLTESELRRI